MSEDDSKPALPPADSGDPKRSDEIVLRADIVEEEHETELGNRRPASSVNPNMPITVGNNNPQDPVSQATEFGWGFDQRRREGSSGVGIGGDRGRGAAGGSNFALQSVVGAGGIGEVWRAIQASLERVVAVKRMQPRFRDQFASDPGRLLELQHSFRQEALITASLEHPNIVPIYDIGQDNAGNPLLAMKLVKGERWDHRIHKDWDKMSAHDFLDRHLPVLVSVTQAVAFAHSKGIVHRDLKPSQVMVGEFGEVLLMDWGLAVYVGPEGGARESSMEGTAPAVLPTPATAQGRAGTPSLMSPEQTMLTARHITRKTDIFLLGATLYFLLTGSYLYEGGTTESAIARAANCDIEPPQQRARERVVPLELARICMMALKKDPAERIESATYFISLLQDYMSGASDRRASDELLQQLRERLATSAVVAATDLNVDVSQSEASDIEMYAEFQSCMSQLDQARGLWPKNPQLNELTTVVLTKYAHTALGRGDMILAQTLIQQLQHGPERVALEAEVTWRERRRANFGSTRRMAIYLSITLSVALLLLLGAFAWQQAHLNYELKDSSRKLSLERQEALRLSRVATMAQQESEKQQYWSLVGFADLSARANRVVKTFDMVYHSFPADLRNWEWGNLLARVSLDEMTLVETALPDQLLHAEISPDGTRIATGDMEGNVALWDAKTGRRLVMRKLHTGGVWSTRFSGDGKQILCSSFDRTATIVDGSTLEARQRLTGHLELQRSGAFSPNSQFVATVGRDSRTRFYKTTGELIWEQIESTSRPYDSDFSPDGTLLAVAGTRSARLLDTRDGRVVTSYPEHPSNVLGIRFSRDGKSIVTACSDRRARIYSTSGTLKAVLNNETSWLHCAAFSLNGEMVATGDDEGRISLWSTASGERVGSVYTRAPVYKLQFAPDGRTLLTCSAVAVQTWSLDRILRQQETRVLAGSDVRDALNLTRDAVAHLRVYSAPFEKRGVWPLYDGKWRAGSGRTEVREQGRRLFVDSYYTAIAPDGQTCVDISPETLKARVINLITSATQPLALTDAFWCEFSPSGRSVVTLSVGEGVTLFDPANWQAKWVMPLSMFGTVTSTTKFVGRAIFTPDESKIVLGAHGGKAYILNKDTGAIEHRFDGENGSAFMVALSADGSRLATGGLSESVNIWNTATGDAISTLTGLEKFMVAIDFSPDGKRLITASNDDRVKLWDVESGREILTVLYLNGEETLVGAAFAPDGRRIIAADSTGRIWVEDAFPWRQLDYPGDSKLSLRQRVEWLKRRERLGGTIEYDDVKDMLYGQRR